MKYIFATAIIALFSSAALTQSATKTGPASSKVAQDLLALNRLWADAITKGDAATLERLFADDIIVTAGNGAIRSKAEEIKDAAGPPDPDFVWTSPFTTENVRVKIYKDAAVVTGLAKWGFKFKGNEAHHERRYTHLYVKQGRQWKIVAQQISANLYKRSAP